VTAPVELRVLSATVIQRGDVRAEVSSSVGVPVSVVGDPVVTQAVVAVGDDVVEGQRVVEVSGRPVFVLQGDVPVYRTLRPAMSGTDVAQLQSALTRLGFTPDSDGVFGELTKTAVDAFYLKAGYVPVSSSLTATADVAAAIQNLSDAEAVVSAAQVALDKAGVGQPASVIAQAEASYNQAIRGRDSAVVRRDTDLTLARLELEAAVAARDRVVIDAEASPGDVATARLAADQAAANVVAVDLSSGDAVDSAGELVQIATLALNEARATGDLIEAQAELDTAVRQRDRTEVALDAVRAANGPTVAQGEIVFVPSMPARVLNAVTTLGAIGASGPSAGGLGDSGASNSQELVELAGGRLVVSTVVRPGDVGLVRVGMNVELLDETTATVYPATISDVADQGVTGADGQLGYPAVVAPADELPDGLTGANLRITITAASTETESLVVPLAAVSSAADGTTRVSTLDDPNGVPVDVAVTAGLSANGFVAIEPVKPGQLTAGDLVVVGR
jgi:peptidoglycan hydrolase-like protein with peptidoglycan-binding domain